MKLFSYHAEAPLSPAGIEDVVSGAVQHESGAVTTVRGDFISGRNIDESQFRAWMNE